MRHSDEVMVADGQKHIQVKGSPGWVRWVNGLARRERVSAAALVDRLLADRARELGHESPPLRCGR